MTHHRYEKLLHLHPTNANEIPRFGDDGDLLVTVGGDGGGDDMLLSNVTAATAAAEILNKDRLTEQERLAVECLKPRYRSPCSPLQVGLSCTTNLGTVAVPIFIYFIVKLFFYIQKFKCVPRRDGGGWRLRNCARRRHHHHSHSHHGHHRATCHCQPGSQFGWRLQLGTAASQLMMDDDDIRTERRLQRDFLKRHMRKNKNKAGGEGGGLGKQHKFLRSLSTFRSSRVSFSGRYKRNVDVDDEEEEGEAPGDDIEVVLVEEEEIEEEDDEKPVDEVLDDIAQEEITEVDIIMEDISDEIKDLQAGHVCLFLAQAV